MTRTKISLTAALLAHIFAWVATLFFLFGPAYSSNSGDTATLIEVNGLWAALLLVVPVALTAVTLIASLPNAPRPRLMLTLSWVAFVLLLLFCAVGIFSIGAFYLPCALAMLVAVIVRQTNKDYN